MNRKQFNMLKDLHTNHYDDFEQMWKHTMTDEEKTEYAERYTKWVKRQRIVVPLKGIAKAAFDLSPAGVSINYSIGFVKGVQFALTKNQ